MWMGGIGRMRGVGVVIQWRRCRDQVGELGVLPVFPMLPKFFHMGRAFGIGFVLHNLFLVFVFEFSGRCVRVGSLPGR